MKSTKIARTSQPQWTKVDQDCENPISQNETKVTQNLPKLTKLTKIART